VKELIRDIVVALVIVLVLTSIIKPTIVKESSMEPTLYENHYLIVNKLAYKTGEPERGDIIVFESDLETDDGDKKLLIKRIIGLPGETIKVTGGNVYIDGQLLAEEYLKDGITPGEIEDCYIEDGELFVMGDNRIVSIDSRELGCINEETVMGKAVLRLFPFNQIGGLYK
jgi:signal peptidase I